MPYTIRLTPSELKNKASEINRNADIVKREVASIQGLVDKLRQTFLGETAAAFFKDFNVALRDMEQWDDIVSSFASEITDAANKLEAADRSHG
jgi:WXG100 family type VII secretion target